MSAYSPVWLGLREPADASARAGELLEPLRRRLAGVPRLTIHDLGCGTGAMGRWLAGRLPGPQRWVLYDRDPALLAHAVTSLQGSADTSLQSAVDTSLQGPADTSLQGPAGMAVQSRQGDITGLAAADLADASLVTASALLDLLTGAEVDRLAAACVEAACPALLTLSVTGEVELSPADPLDAEIAAAFNAHQRRSTAGRALLGPDAPAAAAAAFRRLGAAVRTRPSPWRLGAAHARLAADWLRGWVAAACEHRPELAPPAEAYLHRRLTAAAAGELRVVVGHTDLLALPE